MKAFVAGATGVIGRRLVPLLLARGHDVTAMTRTPAKADAVRRLGADPIVADGLDPDAVTKAVSAARPEVIVHQMTALSSIGGNLRRFDRDFELTNRLRTEGTDALVAAARKAGTRRFVAQSFAGWPYAREGGWVKAEDDPLDPSPPEAMRRTLAAIRHLERAVTALAGVEGVVLRYGALYGPGTSLAADGEHAELVRRRRFPIVGDGAGHWSFVHVDDAAAATVAAIEGGAPGVYNIVDDEPASVSEWLPHLAEALGARPPRRLPLWVGRLATGDVGVSLMTESRGASNAKAKRELGWRPRHPTWRTGFREVLSGHGEGKPIARSRAWAVSSRLPRRSARSPSVEGIGAAEGGPPVGGMLGNGSDLPYVDEHSITVDAAPGSVWTALGEVLSRTFSTRGRTLRRARGGRSLEIGGDPLAAGTTLAGFRVVRAEPGAELALEGEHPFSRYALTFRIDVPEPGRVRLRAETRAAFPGLHGRLYRALVIGTRLHAVVVRRLLAETRRRAERATPPAGAPPH